MTPIKSFIEISTNSPYGLMRKRARCAEIRRGL